jgi:hypothetical protein
MWIKALRHAGLTFYVSEETIGQVSYETSTWFTGYDTKYFYGVGACYAAMTPKTAFIRYLYMVFRTKGKGNLSFSQKMLWMRKGKLGYKKMISYEKYQNTQSK